MQINQWLNHISVRNKLLLFLVMPVVVLLFFVYSSFHKEQQILNEQQHLSKYVAIAFSLSHVITELQKERGLTAGIIYKIENKHNISLLNAQWQRTGRAIELFRKVFKDHVMHGELGLKNIKYIAEFEKNIINIMGIHKSILVNGNGRQYFGQYSQLIKQGIRIIRLTERLSVDQHLSRITSAYISLIQLQEQSAQERGLLNGVFKANKINLDEFRTLSALISSQDIYLKDFYNDATLKYVELLNKKQQHPIFAEVKMIRQDVLNRFSRQELLNEVQQIIGYGGLIHLFKNYVMRGDKKYVKRFEQKIKKMNAIIESFPFQKNTSQHEKDLFQRIVSTFNLYKRLISIVSHQKKIGTDIIEIDQIVRVNDSMALDAIKQLRSRMTYYDASRWWELSTYKVDLFYDISLLMEKEINKQVILVTSNAIRHTRYYLILAIVTIFATFIIGFFLFKRLVKDITGIAHKMENMQLDNENNQLLPIDGNDEISRMSHAFNQMILERIEYENQLQSALENAQAGIVAKGQFLSTMSHEIRTPLNGVLGMSELLTQTPLNKEQLDYIETIMSSGKLLLTIINDILDFSKLEADSVELEQISFNLEKTGYDTLQLLSAAAAEKNIELIFDYPLDIPQNFIADPSRIRQVLLNLINNSIKFTASGHVLLAVSGNELSDDLYRLTLSVKDTGIGINEGYRKKLFESFTQAEQSTTRKYGGTGLGLSICKRLIELMGGCIEVDSKLGEGSNFHFSLTLPVSDVIPENSNVELTGIRALVVDDNPVNLDVINKFLQYHKIETVLLDDPLQVIPLLHKELSDEKISGRFFDVLLLDEHMPELSGFELASKIKKIPEFSTIKLFLLTSGGVKGDAKKAYGLGFSAYHSKPLRADILIQSITDVLANKKIKSKLLTNYNIKADIDEQRINDSPTFTGHILLTEDNIVNQKVALAVLKKLKLTVDVANDGLEAVEKVKNGRYDLIFMDCLMPNMDGFEATQAIRRIENSDEHIPIIALTANALVEDEEKCRAVGMDDFVSKPFKKTDLIKVLECWL